MVAEYTGVSKKLFEQTKRESEVRKERLLTTVNSIREAIVGIDSEGLIRVYNPATMMMFDTNVKLDGKPVSQFLKLVDANGKHFDLWNSRATTCQFNLATPIK